ncbi:MAG: ATP-dependent RNA helicase HrpA [Phycisphaerales bacterium]
MSPTRLEGTFGPDRRRLRRLHRAGDPTFEQSLSESRAEVQRRLAEPLPVSYPEELPFAARVREISAALSEARVVVIAGETGSGKSTQIPKLCLELQRGTHGLIGHTQPRRLAARSVAARVASELGVTLGDDVGCKVRFRDDTSPRTRIKLMTDGVLLAEARSDRWLEQYDTIIVDEAHERSLNIDFLLGILTRVLHQRRDLKLIITSATIDTTRFADHFESHLHERVPVIELTGRRFPVETLYRPPVDEDGRSLDLPRAVAEAAEELAVRDGFSRPGDILVFLPGEREIRETAAALREKVDATRILAGTVIVPLYARLSFDEQQRVFRSSPTRRIVLATNVAETSLTVPGIRSVIDTGTARISRYSPRRRVQSLLVEPISQASASQRAGRCGRTEPGVCIRLYAEDDLRSREEFTPPEIQRSNLAGVILQMRALGLGDPSSFPFVEPPEPRRINEAHETLRELGAADERGDLTPMGERLAKLPVDPRIGRILLEAADRRVLADALIIAAAIETQDPRDRPADARAAADAKHARFADPTSDFLTLLRLWDEYHEHKAALSRAQLRRSLRADYLSFVRFNEWTDTHRQLRDMCTAIGLRVGRRSNDSDALHAAILAGFVTTVGRAHPEGGYTSPSAGRFFVHPGSSVKTKGVQWLVVSELVRTTRLYARSCAKVSADAVEQAAAHLLTREYDDPSYNSDRGIVEASMRVKLGELEIARNRRIDFGSVDRAEARRIFIEQALVGQELTTDAPYERRNRALLRELTERGARLRRNLLPTEAQLVAFFDSRLPPDICSARAFDRWRRRAERERPDLLVLSESDLVHRSSAAHDLSLTPDRVPIGDRTHATLRYTFRPGDASDGIEATLPLEVAATAPVSTLDWLVPGWLEHKVDAVLRGLPKDMRRQLDGSTLARRIAERLRFGGGDFFVELSRAATEATGITVTEAMCRSVPLPDHLRAIIRVIDSRGGEVVRGRDLTHVVQVARQELAKRKPPDEARDLLDSWPDSHPEIHPPNALADAVSGVRLVQAPDHFTALALHRLGCRRLVSIALAHEAKHLLKHAPGIDRVRLLWSTVPKADQPDADLLTLLADIGGAVEAPPATGDDLAQLVQRCRSELADRSNTVIRVVGDTLAARQRAAEAIARASGPSLADAAADTRFQLDQLVHAAALRTIPWPRLERLAAYIRGIEVRLDRARGPGLARDREGMARLLPHWRRCLQRASEDAAVGRIDPLLDAYRWMIEEYRLVLFAPALAIKGGASEKRLNQLWDQVSGRAPRSEEGDPRASR